MKFKLINWLIASSLCISSYGQIDYGIHIDDNLSILFGKDSSSLGNKFFWSPSRQIFRIGSYGNLSSAGQYSVGFGKGNTAKDSFSVVWGKNNNVDGKFQTAAGENNSIHSSARYSNAWGKGNSISRFGYMSSVWGINNVVDGDFNMIWGSSNISEEGRHVTIWGRNNRSGYIKELTTLWGKDNFADGALSTVFGIGNESKSYAETIIGTFAKKDDSAYEFGFESRDRAFTVGNGEDEDHRSDAFVVRKSGAVYIDSVLTIGKTSDRPYRGQIYSNTPPMAYGYINADSTITTGYGINVVNKPIIGQYKIKLDNNFVNNPIVVATPYSQTPGEVYTTTFWAQYPNFIYINTMDENGDPVDVNFSFMVMGW